jgi:hypothetical protein
VVKPSPRQTAIERLDVYSGAYLSRLVEVLGNDYAGLAAVLGREAFGDLAARYVARHPSRHPNLNRFGKRLPEFVAARLRHPRRAFLAELARLEREISLAFDAPEFEPLAGDALARVAATDFGRLVLEASPAVRLLRFAYPVDGFLADVLERDRVPAFPRPSPSTVAIWRRDGRVWRTSLAPAQARVLRALCAGRPLGHALAGARAAPAEVTRWFQEWAGDGMFAGFRLARRGRSPGGSRA